MSLGQMKKQEKVLQEEVKRLTDELAEALKLIKELQGETGHNLKKCMWFSRHALFLILCFCLALLTRVRQRMFSNHCTCWLLVLTFWCCTKRERFVSGLILVPQYHKNEINGMDKH